MAIGIDPGTATIVTSRRGKNGEIKCKQEINAFLKFPLGNRHTFNMLKASKIKLLERDKFAYILGESAVNMAYTLGSDLCRPMKDGTLNPQESEAFEILKTMLHSMVGEIEKDKEILYFCVPADAVNQQTNASYHTKILEQIFASYEVNEKKLRAYSMNEALALVYAELGDKQYSGIGISCLCPGTKIYTKRGIINIEDVRINDEVITHKGRWKKVINTTNKYVETLSTHIKVKGYSESYKFVENHEIYVKRDNEWQWIGCDNVEIGDIIGEPIIKKDQKRSILRINYKKRNTCSKDYKKISIDVSPNLQRLIGYFLSDGSLQESRGTIQFDFNKSEMQYAIDVKDIVKKCLNKKCKISNKSENCLRVKFYDKSLVNWFQKNCYDENKEKKYPWCLSKLNYSECINLLIGLIRGDGWCMQGKGVYFYNTSSNLSLLVKQLFSKIGFASQINIRNPRSGHTMSDGRWIEGKKKSFTIGSGKKTIFKSLVEMIETINCENSIDSQKIWIEDGMCCSRIKSIDKQPYNGTVYDLTVEDDNSFSGPQLTIHNCGGGMTNVCVSIFGQSATQFSIVNSGDWIDYQVSKAANLPQVVVNQEKMKFDLTKPMTTNLERALGASYRILIETAVSQTKQALIKANLKIRMEKPFDIVLGGGVVSPNGFEDLFREVIKSEDMPIPIGDIIKPKDNLQAVSRGLLVAAEAAGD